MLPASLVVAATFAVGVLTALSACTTETTVIPSSSSEGGVAGDGGSTDTTTDGGSMVVTLPDGATVVVDSGKAGGPGDPAFGGSSGGAGGSVPVAGATMTAGAITYRLIVPASYAPTTPSAFLLVYSGTEGGSVMTMNLQSVGPSTGTGGFIRAVLDGVTYNGDGNAGATVLDEIRAKYNIDNDRTYLLGESAGTTAALKLGFHIRQSYFAAYWANDINASDTPGATAATLGFAPNGQVGPGGDFTDANSVIAAMKTAGYIVPTPAPYAGAGAGTHGDQNQFIAAITWFPGKSRK